MSVQGDPMNLRRWGAKTDALRFSILTVDTGIDRFWPWFIVVIVVAFVLRFGLAVAFPNLHRPDEVFQNLEPAFWMWSGGGVVTWEWREGIRSPMFPAFLAGLISISAKVGLGAAGYIAVIAAAMSLLSTGVVAVGFLFGWRQSRWEGAVVCSVLCAVWPDLVYFGPKPLAEIQAGNLLIIAVYVATYANRAKENDPAIAADWRRVAPQMFLAGLLLGLVFCVRFHLSPALLLIAAWSCRLEFQQRWLFLVLGGLLPVIVMGFVDFFFWGSLFHSVWRNYEVNVIQHVSNEWGTQPIYWFFSTFLSEWGAATVPIALTFLLGLRRAPLLGAMAAVIVLSHSAIAHKEISYVYASLPPALVVAGLGTTEIVRWLMPQRRPALGPTGIMVTSVLWIAISVTTALSGGFRPQWKAHAAVLHAEEAVANEPELCGLGVRWPKVFWFWTGGDSYLGRSIPIYAFGTAAGTARVAPAINFAIGGNDVADGLPEFSLVRCWTGDDGNVCLARAERGKVCTPDPNFDLNSVPGLGFVGTDFGADH